jgi:hypothetical protein
MAPVATFPDRPDYKGAPLEAARGPGLGCFWIQVAILAVFVVLTPIGVAQGWPIVVTGSMLIATLLLLFFTGQTAIFLMRLVAADRRARRRPLRSTSRTVGELEDDQATPGDHASADDETSPNDPSPRDGHTSVRQ